MAGECYGCLFIIDLWTRHCRTYSPPATSLQIIENPLRRNSMQTDQCFSPPVVPAPPVQAARQSSLPSVSAGSQAPPLFVRLWTALVMPVGRQHSYLCARQGRCAPTFAKSASDAFSTRSPELPDVIFAIQRAAASCMKALGCCDVVL